MRLRYAGVGQDMGRCGALPLPRRVFAFEIVGSQGSWIGGLLVGLVQSLIFDELLGCS